jgi:hypothetical protein
MPEIFAPRKKLADVTLAMGQQQNPAIGVVRPTGPEWAEVHQESPGRRKEHWRHRDHSRNEAVLRQTSRAKAVADPKRETLCPLPSIEWPDANGFYANLVLRQVRARLGGRAVVAPSARTKPPVPLKGSLTVTEVAGAGAVREPFETLLTELARRTVQRATSVGRCR